ncbi:MAG: hypothetical protein IPK00_02285 [Deltaproteobacteria bacterium]|nr:hypothetical protein [Deltaproteobacteria bacterium]
MSESMSPYGLENDEEKGPSIPAQLRDPVGVLRRGYRWGLIALVALVVPAVLAANLVPLQFESSAALMLTAKAIPDQFVPSVIVQTPAQQFKEIRSRVFTRKGLKKIAEAEARQSGGDEQEIATIVAALRNDLLIEESAIRGAADSESLAIRLVLQGEQPERVASLVNRVSSALIDEYLAYRGDQSQVTLDFMRKEFERSDESLREHQRKLALFREQYRGSLPEEQTATIGRLERLETQRSSIALEVNDLREQVRESGSFSSDGLSKEPSMREQLEAELARLLVLYTDDHPQVQSVRRRIASLEEEDASQDPMLLAKRESISQRRARLDREIASRVARLNDIDSEVKQLESKLGQTSDITDDFRALEREEVILQEAYGQNLRKLKSVELSRSMETSQKGAQLVRVESAVPASDPIIPRFVFIAAAIVVAIALSAVFVVLHELVHPVVIDSQHLEDLTSAPMLGSLPPIY